MLHTILNKGTVRCYIISITLSMIFRAFDETIDFGIQTKLDNKSEGFRTTIDIMVLSSYFTELIPFLIINFVLWKSYLETKELKDNNSSKKNSNSGSGSNGLILNLNQNSSNQNIPSNDNLDFVLSYQASDYASKSKIYESENMASILESGRPVSENGSTASATGNHQNHPLTYY